MPSEAASAINPPSAVQIESVSPSDLLASESGRGMCAIDVTTRMHSLHFHAVRLTKQHLSRMASGHTNSPHPSSREGHHSTVRWISSFSPIRFDPVRFSRCGDLPGPSEFGTVNPDAMHDHGQPTCQGDDRLLYPAMPGNLHRPGLEPGPFCRTHQHALGCFVEHHPRHLVPAP